MPSFHFVCLAIDVDVMLMTETYREFTASESGAQKSLFIL